MVSGLHISGTSRCSIKINTHDPWIQVLLPAPKNYWMMFNLWNPKARSKDWTMKKLTVAHVQINFSGVESDEEFPIDTRETPDLPPEIWGKAVWTQQESDKHSSYAIFDPSVNEYKDIEFINREWFFLDWQGNSFWVAPDWQVRNVYKLSLGTKSRPYIASPDQWQIELVGVFSNTESAASSTSVWTLEDLPTVDVIEECKFQEAATKLSRLSLHKTPVSQQPPTFSYDLNLYYTTLSPEQWDQPPTEGVLEPILEQPEEDTSMSTTHVQASWTFTTTSGSGGASAPPTFTGIVQTGRTASGASRGTLSGGTTSGAAGSSSGGGGRLTGPAGGPVQGGGAPLLGGPPDGPPGRGGGSREAGQGTGFSQQAQAGAVQAPVGTCTWNVRQK